jgi:hypothetical protein
MSNPLTGDYDVVAQISASTLDSVLGYSLGSMPKRIPWTFDDPRYGGTADIHLGRPKLTLLTRAAGPNVIGTVHLVVPVFAFIRGKLDLDVKGSLGITANLEKASDWDAVLNRDVEYIIVNFEALKPSDLECEIEPPNPANTLLEAILVSAVSQRLKVDTQKLALTPKLTGSPSVVNIGYFTASTFANPSFVPPPHDKYYSQDWKEPNFLALFVETSDVTRETPTTCAPQLRASSAWSRTHGPIDDFAILVSEAVLQERFAAEIKKAFGPLPAAVPGFPGTLQSLTLSLEKPHLRIRGTVTIDVKPFPAVDMSFDTSIFPRVDAAGAITLTDAATSVDLPWPLSVAFEDVARITVHNLVQQRAAGAFSGVSLFSGAIPEIGGRVTGAPRLVLQNTDVWLLDGGMALYGTVRVESTQGLLDLVVLNTRSHEFHKVTCPWVPKMSRKHKRELASLYDLFASNVQRDGCATCYPEFNTG